MYEAAFGSVCVLCAKINNIVNCLLSNGFLFKEKLNSYRQLLNFQTILKCIYFILSKCWRYLFPFFFIFWKIKKNFFLINIHLYCEKSYFILQNSKLVSIIFTHKKNQFVTYFDVHISRSVHSLLYFKSSFICTYFCRYGLIFKTKKRDFKNQKSELVTFLKNKKTREATFW